MKAKKTSGGIFWIDGVQKLGEQLAMTLKFVKKCIKKARSGFVWVRPDGKAINCQSASKLAEAIMNYDRRYLREIVKAAANHGIRYT